MTTVSFHDAAAAATVRSEVTSIVVRAVTSQLLLLRLRRLRRQDARGLRPGPAAAAATRLTVMSAAASTAGQQLQQLLLMMLMLLLPLLLLLLLLLLRLAGTDSGNGNHCSCVRAHKRCLIESIPVCLSAVSQLRARICI